MIRPAGWRPRSTCLAPSLAILLLLSAGSRLTAEEQPNEYAKGTDAFRFIVQMRGLTFVHSFEELPEPSKSLLIVLGDLSVLDKVPGGFEGFIKSGGAVLAATDHQVRRQAEAVGILNVQVRALWNLHLSVDGRFLWQDVGRENAYHSLAYCPIVQPATDEDLGIFKGLPVPGEGGPRSGVATNLPSFLEIRNPLPRGLSILAWMPAWCTPTYTSDPPTSGPMLVNAQPFMVGGTQGKGRLLILADHSIFINQMMQRPDNSNILFASHCMAWLNDSGNRDHVYFLEDGVVRDSSDIKIQSLPNPPVPPLPSLDGLIGMGDQLLGGLEQEDVFNRALLSLVPPPVMFHWLLYLVTAGLLFYGISRLRKGRHRVDTSTPLLATAVARATPSVNPIEQRNRSLLESGNLWEPARLLALQFFEVMIGSEAVKPASQAAVRYRLPPFVVNLRGLRAWLLGQRVRRLWRFAHLAAPQPVTIRQFRKLTVQIAGLKEAARRGILRFSSVTPSSVSR